MYITSEIYFCKKDISQEEWSLFIHTISCYIGIFQKWRIIVKKEDNQLRFFVQTKNTLPPSFNHLSAFLLKPIDESILLPKKTICLPMMRCSNDNLIDLLDEYEFKRKKGKFLYLEIEFQNLFCNHFLGRTCYFIQKGNQIYKYHLLFSLPSYFLSVSFLQCTHFFYKKPPKYLDIQKVLHLLSSEAKGALLEMNSFPYLQGKFYLNQNHFTFDQHSFILGASGCGKSKLIDLMISNLYNNFEMREKYRIIVLDPHASLENDIGGLGKVIDFQSVEDSINLFTSTTEDIISTVELLLDLFHSLLNDVYQPKLERVLRYSLSLLVYTNCFSFSNLRSVLLDLSYRNQLLRKNENQIPVRISSFFQSDFTDLKTKYYGEAISPIISFIDEMEMLPIWQNNESAPSLEQEISNQFLTIFSFDRSKLGNRITKMLSGFVMQQLFSLMQRKVISQHILFIVDEVAVIECPILTRFLSESRKYHVSCILAGQYFSQISLSLKNAILANVSNYYIFRIARDDAISLVNHIPMKIPLDDTKESKVDFLTKLNQRECVVRIGENGVLFPAFQGRTLDFTSIPRQKKESIKLEPKYSHSKSFSFELGKNADLKSILLQHSTNKRGVFHE